MDNVRFLLVLISGFVFISVEGKSARLVSSSSSTTFLQAKLEGFHYTKDQLLEDEDDGNRIVGGTRALANEFPFQVSLQMRRQNSGTYSHFCGGSIIASDVILTAAHCCCLPGTATPLAPAKIQVFTGSIDLKGSDGIYTSVKEVSVHESFEPRALDNDICTLKLASKLVFNEATNLIARNNNPTIPEQLETITSGWGVTTENGTTTRYLMKAPVPTVSDGECESVYSELWKPSKVCAGAEGRTSCFGDSGGPLICDGKLYGAVSGGFACGHEKIPVLYTNVAYYNAWIDKQL